MATIKIVTEKYSEGFEKKINDIVKDLSVEDFTIQFSVQETYLDNKGFSGELHRHYSALIIIKDK